MRVSCRSLPHEAGCTRGPLSPRVRHDASRRAVRCGFASLAYTRPRTESPWNTRSPVLARFTMRPPGALVSRMGRPSWPPHPRPPRTRSPARGIQASAGIRGAGAGRGRVRVSGGPGHDPSREPARIVGRVEDGAASLAVPSSTSGAPAATACPARHARRTRFPRTFRTRSGAREGRESAAGGAARSVVTNARTERPSRAPDLVRQTPAGSPHARPGPPQYGRS